MIISLLVMGCSPEGSYSGDGIFGSIPDDTNDNIETPEDPESNSGPTLVVTVPLKSETNVTATQNLVLQFSENVFFGGGKINIRHALDDSIFESISAISAQVTGNGSTTVTVDPGLSFTNNTSYYIEIQNNTFFNIKGEAFAGFTSKSEWPFSTASVAQPVISSIGLPADDYYNETEDISFVLNFDISVSVSGGSPRLALDVGGSTLYAVYASGSGSNALTFTYDVQSGDSDTDGIAMSGTAIDLNGAAIANASDASGLLINDFTALVPDLSGVLVDAILPTAVGSLTFATNDSDNDRSPSMAWAGGGVDAESGLARFELAIGYDDEDDGFDSGDANNLTDWTEVPGGTGVSAYQIVDAVGGFTFTSVFNQNHYVSIRAVDNADNASTITSSASWATFNPNALPNIEQWLDSSDQSTIYTDSGCTTGVVNDGDPVGCWADKSANAKDATATGTDRPGWLVSSAISFVGDAASNANGNCFDIPATTIQSTFFVVNNAADSADGIHGLFGHTTNDEYLFVSTNKGYTFSFDGTGSREGIVATNGGTYSASAENAGAADLSSALQIVSAEVDSPVANWVTLGCFNHSSGAKTYRGNYDLKEIVSTSATLTAGEREEIEGYLACKWDLRDQLPLAHAYYNATASEKSGCP